MGRDGATQGDDRDAAVGHAPGGHLDTDRESDELRLARSIVGARLVEAAVRERLHPAPSDAKLELAGGRYHVTTHGFDRLRIADPVAGTPEQLLDALGIDHPALREELDDAVANLAVAYRRRAGIDAEWRARPGRDAYARLIGLDGDLSAIAGEQLATDGHNLHPCGRTRLGWTPADVLAHDQESPATRVGFVAVRRDAHVGDDVGALLREGYPWLPEPPPGHVLQPVHEWQLHRVLTDRYPDRFAEGDWRRVDGVWLAARPTTALRTVLLEPDRHGRRRYLKLSLDIQVTSTRRSISVAATRNGPVVSALLARLVTDPRAMLFPEIAGAAVTPGRDVAVIVREGFGDRLGDGEVAIPGTALPARSPITGGTLLDEVVDRFAATRASDALGFVRAYAELVVPPALALLAAGIGLEAHLQNSIPVFRDGVPVRIAWRDFAGLRLHRPRLAARGFDVPLWEGSVIGADDLDVVRAKLGYTLFQAHLGEIVLRLAVDRDLDERAAWSEIRAVVDDARASGVIGADDHAWLTAPTMPHKALVRMRLAPKGGDVYVPVTNPLTAP